MDAVKDTLQLDHIYIGDCIEVLQHLPDQSVDMVITSPPYFNLRDYGVQGQIGSEASVRQGMNKKRGEKLLVLRKNLPEQATFVDFLRSRTSIDDIVANSDLKRSKVEHWFRKDQSGFAYPSAEDWNAIKWLLDDWSEDFAAMDRQLTEVTIETDGILKNAHKGRIKRAVWSINTRPFSGYHYAPFPEELVKTPILACSPEGGVVLDPFMGSGTTAVVSKKLKRHYIGIELNPDYAEVAKQRIEEAVCRKEGETLEHPKRQGAGHRPGK